MALGGVLASACGPPAPEFGDPKTLGTTREEMQQKAPDLKAFVLLDRATKRVDTVLNVAGMPDAAITGLTREAAAARIYDKDAQTYGTLAGDLRQVSALRISLANYLDRLAEFVLTTKMLPKVSPLSADCWTSAPMSSSEARGQREQLLNRAQLSLRRATVNFSMTQAGKAPTAEAFNTSLISGASRAFYELRGIERPSIEQMEDVYKAPLRSEFLAFGHCVFWKEGDFTKSLGPAT